MIKSSNLFENFKKCVEIQNQIYAFKIHSTFNFFHFSEKMFRISFIGKNIQRNLEFSKNLAYKICSCFLRKTQFSKNVQS